MAVGWKTHSSSSTSTMNAALVLAVCVAAAAAAEPPRLINDNALIRYKRQYYLCGTAPNQWYSTVPCYQSAQSCTNGGKPIGVGCTSSAQCTPYYAGTSTCLQGCCCTVPAAPSPPGLNPNDFGVCASGQWSQARCSGKGQCAAGQTCMNGLCCTTTGKEFESACGGLAALSSCSASGTCGGGAYCTASNYCCECPVGRASGRCGAGNSCPAGFSCQANGYCCASCPGNVMPYGACINGSCGGGKKCCAGNICC